MQVFDKNSKPIPIQTESVTLGWVNPQWDTDKIGRAYALSIRGVWNDANLRRFRYNRLDSNILPKLEARIEIGNIRWAKGELEVTETSKDGFAANFQSDVVTCIEHLRNLKLHDVLRPIEIRGVETYYQLVVIAPAPNTMAGGWTLIVNDEYYYANFSAHGSSPQRVIDEYFIPQINARLGQTVASRINTNRLIIQGHGIRIFLERQPPVDMVAAEATNANRIAIWRTKGDCDLLNFQGFINNCYTNGHEAVAFPVIGLKNDEAEAVATAFNLRLDFYRYWNNHYGDATQVTYCPLNQYTTEQGQSGRNFAPCWKMDWILRKLGEAAGCAIRLDPVLNLNNVLIVSDKPLENNLKETRVTDTQFVYETKYVNSYGDHLDPRKTLKDDTIYNFLKKICVAFDLYFEFENGVLTLKKRDFQLSKPMRVQTDVAVRTPPAFTGRSYEAASGEKRQVGNPPKIEPIAIPISFMESVRSELSFVRLDPKKESNDGFLFLFDGGIGGDNPSKRHPIGYLDPVLVNRGGASLVWNAFFEQFHRANAQPKGGAVTFPYKIQASQLEKWQHAKAQLQLVTPLGQKWVSVESVEVTDVNDKLDIAKITCVEL